MAKNSVSFRLDDLPDEEKIRRHSREIRQQVGDANELVTSVGWDALRGAAVSQLKEGLAEEDGLTWLARAWTVSRELEAAAIETLSGETVERLIPLSSHHVGQELHPIITLSCAGLELPLEFTLDLGATVDSVDLVVRRGWLTAIQAGRLIPSASLSFHGIELGEKTGAPIDLLEPYELVGGGFQIMSESDLPPDKTPSFQPGPPQGT